MLLAILIDAQLALAVGVMLSVLLAWIAGGSLEVGVIGLVGTMVGGLAVWRKERIAAIPDIPTIAEAGVQGCESDTWHALTAPPKTPGDVIAKLNDAANKAMADPGLLERYKSLSITPGGGTPVEMSAFLKQETTRWGDVIRAAGIQPQ